MLNLNTLSSSRHIIHQLRLRLKFKFRFNSTSAHSSLPPSPSPLPPSPLRTPSLSPPIVSKHLILVAGLVFTIVIVGGYTRLTESGLSITEWNLVSGILPPLNQQDWEKEFEKYKSTPEFQVLNQSIELKEFQKIFFWEWFHRLMGRFIGITFLLPIPFFIQFGWVQSNPIRWSLLGIASLIGSQGALGWYMVRSGLEQDELDSRDGIPRVSQYRLAAHLLLAFTVYSACIRLSGATWRDWKIAVLHRPLFNQFNHQPILHPIQSIQILNHKIPNRARILIHSLTALIFFTAGSGAFVAGLDAGLVYNTFPKMGNQWIPDRNELISPVYTNRGQKDQSTETTRSGFTDLRWMRNIFENPTTVQFNHRILGITTFLSSMSYSIFIEKYKKQLPKSTLIWSRFLGLTAFNQVGLGIATLIYLVPTPLALLHQSNSLLLLSFALFTGLSLRRPGLLALESLSKKPASILVRPKLPC